MNSNKFLDPSATISKLLSPSLNYEALRDLNKGKNVDEFKLNPKLVNYYKDMLSNPNKIMNKVKKVNETPRMRFRHRTTSRVNYTKPSASLFVKKHKCMEENMPESKRNARKKETSLMR